MVTTSATSVLRVRTSEGPEHALKERARKALESPQRKRHTSGYQRLCKAKVSPLELLQKQQQLSAEALEKLKARLQELSEEGAALKAQLSTIT